MKCVDAREALPGSVRDGHVSSSLRRHLARCAACSAEMTRYERLLDSLHGLQGAALEPPPELFHSLVSIPQELNLARSLWWRAGAMRGHVVRHWSTYLGGAGVALAGAAGALVWRRRVATPA